MNIGHVVWIRDKSVISPKNQQTSRPASVLRHLSTECSSGCLQVDHGDVQWQIILETGRLVQASCSALSVEVLEDYLRNLEYDKVLAIHPVLSPERLQHPSQGTPLQAAVHACQQQGLTPQQTAQLTEALSKDALESLLWLPTASCQWIPSSSETEGAWLASVGMALGPLIDRTLQRLRVWEQIGPSIQSPHQRPYLFDQHAIQASTASPSSSESMLGKLARLMRGLSIRQIAMMVRQDELKVAQFLVHHIENGSVYLRSPRPPLDQLPSLPIAPARSEISSITPCHPLKRPQGYKITCIDDSPTLLDQVQRYLDGERFEVTKISDPIKAAVSIFREQPDLILLDITMPGISGYQFCNMLRGTKMFRKVPIIMVSGNSGLIDKTRARLVGATDYLTKPFNQADLLAVVEKYLRAPEDPA